MGDVSFGRVARSDALVFSPPILFSGWDEGRQTDKTELRKGTKTKCLYSCVIGSKAGRRLLEGRESQDGPHVYKGSKNGMNAKGGSGRLVVVLLLLVRPSFRFGRSPHSPA